jgi:ABC-type lipoprotein export system ATPase subunit
MASAIIQMEHVRKTYDGNKYVLEGLSFSAGKGELAIIKGKSGSGKSTLLNIVGLLDVHNSGVYRLNGAVINPKRHNRYAILRSKFIGFIFQSYQLIDSISIQDNILLPYMYSSQPISSNVIKRMHSILEEFNLTALRHKKVSLLSGGEKQRVAIARATIKKPPVIIADEPTGNLDDDNSSIVINHLKNLTQQNTTVILVTHNMNLLEYADSAYALHEGRLV